MSKLITLTAFGAGYVLGSRAGRERYEQLRSTYEKVKNDPRVQEKAHQAADVVKDRATPVAEAVREKVTDTAGAAASAASAAKGKVSGGASPSDAEAEAAADADLNPDRLKLTDDTGPQGTLP